MRLLEKAILLSSLQSYRNNLPQIRGDMSDSNVRALAESFGVPVLIDSPVRPGSLREAASSHGVPVLVYEAGEALRFDEFAITRVLRGGCR